MLFITLWSCDSVDVDKMASPQQSGYQRQFVDSVEDYECPLCLHVTREPFLTSCCGQHFCQVCISRILTENKPCPLCKENTFTTLLDKKQKRRILSLKVYCDTKAKGCQWVDCLGELEKHLNENCQFVEVNCSHDCGLAFQRRVLAKHQTDECPKRPDKCPFCDFEGTYQEIQDDHLPVCPWYPEPCPNQCGVSLLERDKLEDHLRECPLQLVECELKEMGCEEMVKREDLATHMEERTQKHLILMSSKYLQSVRVQNEMKQHIKVLQEENKKLAADLAQTKQKLIDTERGVYDLCDKLKTDLNHTKRRLTGTEQALDNFHDKLKSVSTAEQPIISNLAAKVETIRRYIKTSFVQFYVPNFSKQIDTGRWENRTEFYTYPSRCKMKINLYFCSNKVEIELTHILSSVDDRLHWPMNFAVTVRILNQTGDYDHYEVTKDLTVNYDTFNDSIKIKYWKIRNPPLDAKYLQNDCLKFQVLIEEI